MISIFNEIGKIFGVIDFKKSRKVKNRMSKNKSTGWRDNRRFGTFNPVKPFNYKGK